MKRLILMRHAKTEPWDELIDDHGRALTDVGHQAADVICAALQTSGWAPDKAVVSSARRTRETWKHVLEAFPDCSVQVEEALYLASMRAISEIIQRHHGASTLLIIGHNPGIHELALSLVRESGSQGSRAASRLSVKMPTGATALFEAASEGSFRPSELNLIDFYEPKDLVQAI